MKIILARHAAAVDKNEAKVCYDAERPLSEVGRQQARQVGRLLHFLGCLPDPVVTSPFVRAQETGAIICAQLGQGVLPTPLALLAPGSSSDEVLRAAMNYGRTEERWMLAVMHEPDVSLTLGALLCAGKPYPFTVNPADIFGLDVQSSRGQCCGTLVFCFSVAKLQ